MSEPPLSIRKGPVRRGTALGVDWVLLGPEPWLATCARCGGRIDKPPLPQPVAAFCAVLEAQVKAHAGCLARRLWLPAEGPP